MRERVGAEIEELRDGEEEDMEDEGGEEEKKGDADQEREKEIVEKT